MMHSLTLGSLLLTDSDPDNDHDFMFDVLADGVGFGVAAGVKEVVTSLLADGDLIRTTRYGNREVSFVVEITGPDLASLAHGEAALRREVGRGNALTWQPPDEFAAASVFEVVDSEMSQKFDDLDELGKRRKYTLTLTCAPFARSLEPVTFLASDPGATTITPRQLSRSITVGGTERTPGSIHVESANGTDPLGLTIVHTCPETFTDYLPPLRRWRVAGNTVTPEAARFSGAYEPTEPNAFVAQVPNAALPVGDYLLVAQLYSTAPGAVTVNWAAGTIVNSEPQSQDTGTEVVEFPAAGWFIFDLTPLSLPTVRSLGPVTQIDIQTSGADGVTTQIDEAWLFRMGDDCGLTIVSNPTANLWLDSPDISSGVPRVWIGDIGDRSDARHPAAGLISMGSHILSPDGTALFTAAESDNPETSGEGYRRWHSNAAS